MRHLIIKDGLIENVIELDIGSTYKPAKGRALVPYEDPAAPGWTWDGIRAVEPQTPVAPVAVPPVISDRQFFQGLAVVGIITKEEALAAVKVGTIPPVLQAMVDAIPDAEARFAAEMLLSGATQFQRDHALTTNIGAAYFAPVNGKSSAEQVDDFFRLCAAL